MSEFKAFQGKTLDEAIEAACSHFELKRDKLEIEIVRGGSTGIFGLMGVKKAEVKARARRVMDTDDFITNTKKTPPRQKQAKTHSQEEQKCEPTKENVAEEKKPKPRKQSTRKPPREEAPRAEDTAPSVQQEEQTPEQRPARTPRPVIDEFADMDKEALEAIVREVVGKMLFPMVGEAKMEITFDPDRIKVFIDDEENSGLIIGREGQTLASLQYLANRLVSRRMEASIRIQIDTGEYRERQDEKLRQIALHFADKACRMGRTQSTKPLSSYHRRVVHLTLQESENVFTRSKGDGPMKRVLIVPKRRNARRSQRD